MERPDIFRPQDSGNIQPYGQLTGTTGRVNPAPAGKRRRRPQDSATILRCRFVIFDPADMAFHGMIARVRDFRRCPDHYKARETRSYALRITVGRSEGRKSSRWIKPPMRGQASAGSSATRRESRR